MGPSHGMFASALRSRCRCPQLPGEETEAPGGSAVCLIVIREGAGGRAGDGLTPESVLLTTRSPTPLNPNWKTGTAMEALSGTEWENTCEAPESLPSRSHVSGACSLPVSASPTRPHPATTGCPPKPFLPPQLIRTLDQVGVEVFQHSIMARGAIL